MRNYNYCNSYRYNLNVVLRNGKLTNSSQIFEL